MDGTIALVDSIQAIAASFGASFDAEKIIDTVEKEGTRYYKVRWVKHSWEPCTSFVQLEHLIRDFWIEHFNLDPNHFVDSNGKVVDSSKSEICTPEPIALPPDFHHEAVQAELMNVGDVTLHKESREDSQADVNSSSSLAPFETCHDDPDDGHLSITHNDDPDDGHLSITNNEEQETYREVPNEQQFVQTPPKKRRKIPGSCDICGKLFKSTTNISAHRKLHTEERKFECAECGRKFRRSLHLQRHAESHVGLKKFVCEVCGSAFSSKWYMDAHQVLHTGEQPFACHHCGRQFNNKANLNKHAAMHTDHRPFICNVCGRTYHHSYDLKRHAVTHRNSKDFVCTYCGRSFARKAYLSRHLQTHESTKNFSCPLCSRKFFQRGHLNLHLKKQHPTCSSVTALVEDPKQREHAQGTGNEVAHRHDFDVLAKSINLSTMNDPLGDACVEEVVDKQGEVLELRDGGNDFQPLTIEFQYPNTQKKPSAAVGSADTNANTATSGGSTGDLPFIEQLMLLHTEIPTTTTRTTAHTTSDVLSTRTTAHGDESTHLATGTTCSSPGLEIVATLLPGIYTAPP